MKNKNDIVFWRRGYWASMFLAILSSLSVVAFGIYFFIRYDNFPFDLFFIAVFIPIIIAIISFIYAFFIKDAVCVLTETGIGYYGAFTDIKGERGKKSGFVFFEEIEKVKNIYDSKGIAFRTVISGKGFEITLDSGAKLADKIRERAAIEKPTEIIPHDLKGLSYENFLDVPFYDRSGNIYNYENLLCIRDGHGRRYNSEYCYIGRDGYLFYTEKELAFADNIDGDFVEYYTDGANIYVSLWQYVYWDREGKMFRYDGSNHYELTYLN